MKEILPGIFEWSWYSTEKGYDFNGHLVVSGKERVLIDPPPMTPEEEEQVKEMGPLAAILITNVHHTREASKYRNVFGTKVLVPEKDAQGIDMEHAATFRSGDFLPAGLEALGVPNNKSAGETALYLARNGGIWILGDALIGNPKGNLSLMTADKYKDISKAKEGIRVLLGRDFSAVLVGDGVSLLHGGRQALDRFLD